MRGKGKGGGGNKGDGNDALIRMNFLLQAAHLLTACRPPQSQPRLASSVPTKPDGGRHRTEPQPAGDDRLPKQTRNVADGGGKRLAPISSCVSAPLAGIGRYYAGAMKKVSAKMVLRIDPHVKRSLCKRCDTVLIPGVTSRIRTADKPELLVKIECLACLSSKHLPCRPGHTLYTEKEENTTK
ncbi:RNAse P Rpr2/Rpp21/SNM1 subunit domain-containing protein [Zopfochytrium polystomum]|nr:RNAse P Rpr2/Rpp21/SNM1 subunit domain-containing protein [Zopfochytrium polystomum]